jgi:hypothetical protein
MEEKRRLSLLLAIVLTTAIIQPAMVHNVTDGTPLESVLKPFKAIVVIDIDWASDPESYVERSRCAFHDAVSLLKLWSIPFDVLRLDNTMLNITQFVDIQGKPKYGVIIWNCQQNRFVNQDWSVLQTAVMTHGISLIALANTILEPRIQNLLGINYADPGWYRITNPFIVTTDHFITRGYIGVSIPAGDYGQEGTMGGYGSHVVFNSKKASVLGSQGQWPQLAVRDISESTKAVWIGGNRDEVYHLCPIMGNLLRRAITYCVGYSLFKTYPDTVLLRIDDMGSAQSAYLSSWHYPQLTREQIKSSLIQPLLEHNATLAVMYSTGYPRHIEQTVLKSWTLDWIDPYGTRQNLTSDYLGILDGIAEGVLEVQSHGWTHMQPDLDSTPGPWWNNPGGTEWPNVGWYREFYDARRDKEIDSATQESLFDRSIQYTQEAFGTYPLSFVAGGYGISGATTLANYTHKLAALKGFGLAFDDNGYCYLGPIGDMVISQMRMTRTFYLNQVSEIRTRLRAYGGWDVPLAVYFHDRELSLDSSPLTTYLYQLEAPATSTENPVQHYMSTDEFVGYMHAKPSALSSGLGFTFEYDSHYCRYFVTHNSKWTLHLSDTLLAKFRDLGKIDVIVDGAYNGTTTALTYFDEVQSLIIPQGGGTHTIRFVNHHDVAIVNVVPSTTKAVFGTIVNINATVRNKGSVAETFNVTTYYGNNTIGAQVVSDLAPETTAILTFGWNTSFVPIGNHTLRAEASAVLGELDTDNIVYIDGIIRIVKPPVAHFTCYPLIAKINDPLTFNASSSAADSEIISYEWNFGDGYKTSTPNPIITHLYALPGTYNATLTVIDYEGLNASTWDSVDVSARTEAKISIFTYSSSSFVGFKVDINGTLADVQENGISDAKVFLSYNFPSISDWIARAKPLV